MNIKTRALLDTLAFCLITVTAGLFGALMSNLIGPYSFLSFFGLLVFAFFAKLVYDARLTKLKIEEEINKTNT